MTPFLPIFHIPKYFLGNFGFEIDGFSPPIYGLESTDMKEINIDMTTEYMGRGCSAYIA